jgi:transposase
MNYSSKDLGHLGLVAGMCDELEIVSLIDKLLPNKGEGSKVSTGTCVKALIMNGLGFVGRRLYLVSDFFEDKPTEHLLGAGITADLLNDDRLGRCLDSLYEFGVSELFTIIAQRTYTKLGLSAAPVFYHSDSTSFHLDGVYNSDSYKETDSCIHLTQGYSRDHRPDLNQACLNMIVENSSGIPLYINALSGNSNDKTTIAASIFSFTSSLQNAPLPLCWVADSALYSAENIKTLSTKGMWLTRVPDTISEVDALKSIAYLQDMQDFEDDKLSGYRYVSFGSIYGTVAQEWLLIYSKQTYQREIISLHKELQKGSCVEIKWVENLCKQVFDCEKDAEKAVDTLRKKCKYIDFSSTQIIAIEGYQGKGKPKKEDQKIIKGYQIKITYCSQIGDYEDKKKRLGYFILASNDINGKLSPTEKLLGYKDQSKVEKGFRFLKDPAFQASTIFVKKPERVEAVLMLMALSLLVYSALERTIRKALIENKETLPNQNKKQIQNPTMKWVFVLLKGIHCLYLPQKEEPILLNINDIHQKIINIFSKNIRKYYNSQ